MEGHKPRHRSLSEPTEYFEAGTAEKKGSGFANFLHKLPFLSGKYHQHSNHSDRSSSSDDEFCDLEEEMKKAAKHAKGHKKSHKSGHHQKESEFQFDENGAGDSRQQKENLKHIGKIDDLTSGVDKYLKLTEKNEEIITASNSVSTPEKILVNEAEKGTENCKSLSEKDTIGDNNLDVGAGDNVSQETGNNEDDKGSENVTAVEEEPPHLHEPPPSPLPPPAKSCLKYKSCRKEDAKPPRRPQMRKRSLSVPEGDPCIIFRLNRHVHFSPGTVDPTPRNCRYREWIERHCSHKNVGASVNIRHEKRMQKLKQIHSLDINKYLSKNNQNYHSAMMSPMRSLGCDIFM